MSFNTRETRRSRISFAHDKGLTEQHHKDSCDMRLILKKYEKTGICEHNAKHAGQYMDYPNAPTFQEAMNVIATATSTFESVPAEIRQKFHNDPAEFLEFIQNSENREEMQKMGFDVSHIPKPKLAEAVDVTSSTAEGSNTEPETAPK